jgi:hydroxyacylglutathione hydrolase
MTIQIQPMGFYQTNCYIVTIDGKDFIIDPGEDAIGWVKTHVTNPVAILNTHGHFDHVWCNHAVQEAFGIPLYTPQGDVPMLLESPFMSELPPSVPDIVVEGDTTFEIASIPVTFRHFPGHSPGCSTIEIGGVMFSGDFIFQGSIGRYDFIGSDAGKMRDSLERFMEIEEDMKVYPGHGAPTTIKAEQRNIPYWLERF